MEILLLILKVIGIVLLVLLLLFSALILSVVLIPVRYRIKGRAASPDEIEAGLTVSWMLHLIHGRIQISGSDISYNIRLLGIPVPLGAEKKPKRNKTPRKKRSSPQKRARNPSGHPKENEAAAKETNREGRAETPETKDFRTEAPGDHSAGHQTIQKKHKIQLFLEGCKAWLLRLKQIAVGLKNKTITWNEQFSNIKNIILEETNKNAVICLFREFRYLLKHFSPRKASGTLQYGTQDPAITGQILGGISLFPFWYRYQISVQPDFNAEDFYARGDLAMKGHIRTLHMLRTGIRLIKDKDFRRLINQIRK